MSDYDKSRDFGTNAYPVSSIETSDLMARCEPIMTPDKLASRYLNGVDISCYQYCDLEDEIKLAINEFELETKIFVNKIQLKQRVAYDRQLYRAMVYVKTNHRPILSVDEFNIESSNGEKIFKIPPAWVEMGHAFKGQINVIPLLSILSSDFYDATQNAGLVFLQALQAWNWLPAFWTIKYTTGISHTEGQVPTIVNDIIGMTAAINILAAKQNQNIFNATSIAQDGIVQSGSSGGTNVYTPRIQILSDRKAKMMKQLKAQTNNRFYITNL